jgi:signal transduction histidine kinase
LEPLGLGAALQSHVTGSLNLTGIEITVDIDPGFPRLTGRKETALFRIAQEALQNAVKHAIATKVAITLAKTGGMTRLTIADNGKGFVDVEALPRQLGVGWGLTNMRERAESIGGIFQVHSVVGEGTVVEVEVKAQRRQSA